MAARKKSDSQLLAELKQDQLRLRSEGHLNGTKEASRQRLEVACSKGLDLTGLEDLQELHKQVDAPPDPEPATDEPEPDTSIDVDQVRRFIELLGKEKEQTCIRAFVHKTNPNKGEIGARQAVLNIKNLKEPERWQQEQRGVYAVVNNGGNDKESITSCPACFFELDGLTKAQQLERIGKIPELKDLIGMTVATREGDAGSLHSYFLLDAPTTDVSRWRLMQWRLIQLYSSDSKVEDPSRVMRLPGAWYALGDGTLHSRSHIVENDQTGKRLSLEELDKAVSDAEFLRGKDAVSAVPDSRWKDEEVIEMMTRLFPEETAKRQQKKETLLNGVSGVAGKTEKPWHTARTLDEIKEALSIMPPRTPGHNTYEEDREVMSGLASALEEVGLERGHAIPMLEEEGWTGWNAEQVLNSSHELGSAVFWAHARKCGWKPQKERKKEELQLKREVANSTLIEDLQDLVNAGIGGPELLDKQLGLMIETGIALHQIQKIYGELIQNDEGIERMTEALDLITTAQEEEPISVAELVPEKFYREVIQDFQKGIEADELMILMLVLTTMSSVLPIGTKVRLLDFTKHDQAVLLYFLILTMSGGKKTLLFDELVEKPIMQSEIKVAADRKLHTVERHQAQEYARKKSKETAEEGSDDDEPTKTSSTKISPLQHIVGDFSGEGVDRNCEQAEKFYGHGFLIGTDEGRQLLAGDQYKGGSSTYTTDKLTRLYDGKGNNQVRGNIKNERHYTESHVAICALLQPEIYDQIATQQADDESGFWPRFQTVECNPVRIKRANKEERDAAKVKTYPTALKELYGAANLIGSNHNRTELGAKPHFRFSEEAQDWWYDRALEIENQQHAQVKNGDAMVARVLGKASGQVGRLAALLHLLNELVDGMSWNRTPSEEISLATVEKAYRLQARLMSRTIKQRLRATTDGVCDDTKLLKDLQSRCLEKDPEGKGLSIAKIERFWNQKYRPDKESLYQAISALVMGGFGEANHGSSNHGGFTYKALKPLTV